MPLVTVRVYKEVEALEEKRSLDNTVKCIADKKSEYTKNTQKDAEVCTVSRNTVPPEKCKNCNNGHVYLSCCIA